MLRRRQANPWPDGVPSILEHLRAHLPDDDLPGLLPGGERLPDTPEVDGGQVRWAPGAMDGVVVRHTVEADARDGIDELLELLRRTAASDRGGRARGALYEAARGGRALPVVDGLLGRIRDEEPDRARFLPVARWLAFEGRHRDAVKLGIALLGLAHTDADREQLMVLGRSEELTLFVAVALVNTSDQPDRELYQLARQVTGWGRIHLVERMRRTGDPEIRDWIFREGFRNDVMNEYLAHVAATTGDLVGQLERSGDAETLRAACDIVGALLGGGPAEDIHDYRDAPRALVLLLRRLLETPTPQLEHLVTALYVTGHLDLGVDPTEDPGWTTALLDEAQALSAAVQARPEWDSVARSRLAASDWTSLYLLDRAAGVLAVDTWDAHCRRVTAAPVSSSWFALVERAGESRIDEVVALAEELLALDQLASGPALEIGLGFEWEAHSSLAMSLQFMPRFPGKGWSLLARGLQSPVLRCRNMAITALFAWDRRAWPPDAEPVLAAAAAAEPDDRIKERLHRLLRGEPDT